MSKRSQTDVDLGAHLRDHLAFLQASATSFDGGFEAEAKRMAVSIRVLLHDTHASRSLLGQMQLRDQRFVDSSLPYDPRSVVPHAGLVMLASGGKKHGYVANLNGASKRRRLPLDQWWNGIVFVDDRKKSMSRRELVLAMANKDGGAHVDPELDETYARLSRDNSMGWISGSGALARPILDVELASMRQIAHEVLLTLVPNYSCARPQTGGIVFGGVQVYDGVPPEFLWRKATGRNDACPCGSGKKYKKCHGSAYA